MSFTYTDRNAKTVLHSWGRFRGAVEEAVVVGDLLAIKEDADSGFQLANVTSTQTAVAVACQDGKADQTIWMAMIAELKAPTTISTGGVATQTYFAASGDTMGSAVYLSTTDGKLSSSQGAVVQVCGYIVARDRVLVVPTTYLSAASLAISGALTVGTTLGVSGATSLGDTLAVTGITTLSALLNADAGIAVDTNKFTVADGTGNTLVAGTLAVTGATTLTGDLIFATSAGKITDGTTYTTIYGGDTANDYLDLYGNSSDSVRIRIAGSGSIGLTSTSVVVGGNLSVNGDTELGDNVKIATDKQLRFRNENSYIYSNAANSITIIAPTSIVLNSTNGVYIGSNRKLYFRDTNTKIYSFAANKLAINAGSSSAEDAIILQCGTTGGIKCNGYLKLKITDTDGGNEGQLWYDASENNLKFHNGTSATSVGVGSGGTVTGSNRIYFRDSGISLYSGADGRLYIASDGSDFAAVTYVLPNAASGGGVNIDGFVKLWNTTNVGSVEGQIWYDGTTNKIHFWNGTAEQEVTSGNP